MVGLLAKKTSPSDYLTYGERLTTILKRLSAIVFGRTTPQRFFRYYLLVILLGAILLYVPVALNSGRREDGTGSHLASWNFMDALFTASSAFSDTGLVVASTADTFSLFGQIVIVILIQVGGIGFMTIKLLIWRIFLSGKTSLSERIMLQAERGASKLGTSTHMILCSSLFILAVELICGLGLMFYFYFYPAQMQIADPNPIYAAPCAVPLQSATPSEATTCTQLTVNSGKYVAAYHNWSTAAWWGFFHSISAMNNAGFDIIGGNSLAPYRNDGGVVLQGVILTELIIGGLGFPLIFDVLQWFKTRATRQRFRFSLFTKISITAYLAVAVIGLAGTYGAEEAAIHLNSDGSAKYYVLGYDNANGAFGVHETFNKWWNLTFMTFSTRNAGFAPIDPHALTTSTKYIQGTMMFIGAAPSSTAGGIRTTTLAIMLLTVVKRMMGRERVSAFKKTLPRETVRNSFTVFFVALALVALGVFIVQLSPYLDTAPSSITFVDSFYEVSSAFGTTGLSTGLTAHLQWWSLLYLALLMFIGQLGVSSSILSWAKKESRHNTYLYPSEDVVIG